MAPPTQPARGSQLLGAHPPNLPTPAYAAADPARVESLQACVEAARRSTANFLALGPAEVPGLPMAQFAELTHAAQALFRLSQLDDAGWDRRAVRGAVDVVAVLDGVAALLAVVAPAAGFRGDAPGGGGRDLFTDAAAALRATIPTWRAALAHASPDDDGIPTAVAASSLLDADGGAPAGEMLPPIMGTDPGDSLWFTDMFSFWDN